MRNCGVGADACQLPAEGGDLPTRGGSSWAGPLEARLRALALGHREGRGRAAQPPVLVTVAVPDLALPGTFVVCVTRPLGSAIAMPSDAVDPLSVKVLETRSPAAKNCPTILKGAVPYPTLGVSAIEGMSKFGCVGTGLPEASDPGQPFVLLSHSVCMR